MALAVWHAPIADKTLRMPADLTHKDDLIAFPENINASGRPVRLSLFSNPKNDDFMQVWGMGHFGIDP